MEVVRTLLKAGSNFTLEVEERRSAWMCGIMSGEALFQAQQLHHDAVVEVLKVRKSKDWGDTWLGSSMG